jgi:mRNA interferase RelE/StbE
VRILETDPHAGKPLRADLAGKWSIRTGDYRVIYQINEEGKIVLLYHAMHRKKVYR